ncbi:hypothetical protein BB560_007185, partial [Smittium megazygosporum]
QTEIIQPSICEGENFRHVNTVLRRGAGRDSLGIVKAVLEHIKLLLDRGADIHADSEYAWREASRNRHVEAAKLLLDCGADIHSENHYYLSLASERGYRELAKVISNYESDIHAQNDDALKFATQF